MADGAGRRWSPLAAPRSVLPLLRDAFETLGRDGASGLARSVLRLRGKRRAKAAMSRRKQLLVVNGESLLERQVRLLRANGVDDIFIASRFPDCAVPGAQRYRPVGNIYEIDRFLSSRALWHERGDTLYVYGDVFYTDSAMRSLCRIPPDPWMWFGRSGPGRIPGQQTAEIFGLRFASSAHAAVERHARHVREEFRAGRISRCIGWELYKSLEGLPLASSLSDVPLRRFHEIRDITNDFDTRQQYLDWLHHVTSGALNDSGRSVERSKTAC